jgi:hypothetical protein
VGGLSCGSITTAGYSGLFYWNANNSSSNTNSNHAARAFHLKNDFKGFLHFIFLTAWSKIRRRLRHGLVGLFSKDREANEGMNDETSRFHF